MKTSSITSKVACPDDWEAFEETHNQETNMTDAEIEVEIRMNLAQQSSNRLISCARRQSSKYAESRSETSEMSASSVCHAYLVGYYEGMIRRLAELPEVRDILDRY